MSDTCTKKIVKDNTVIQEVWVTHWDLCGWGPHVESVSLRPWEADYTAPITKYADNTRFVNADHAQAEKEAAAAAAYEAALEMPHRDVTPTVARAALKARDARVRENALWEAMPVAGALAAAISLLDRSRQQAPSDKMFEQMVADYERALDDFRALIDRTAERET